MLSSNQILSPTVIVGSSENGLSKVQIAQRERRERERETKRASAAMAMAAAGEKRSKNGIIPNKRAAAQQARRDREKKAKVDSGIQSCLVSSNFSSVVLAVMNRHRIQSSSDSDQVSVNLGVGNVIGKGLANRPFVEVGKEQGNKETVALVNNAPTVSVLPAATFNKNINTLYSAVAPRCARRETKKKAWVPSLIPSNGRLVFLPVSKHAVHTRPIQHSDNQVASNPERPKVIGVNLVNPPVAEHNQKQGDKENNVSVVKTSRVSRIPTNSLSKKIYIYRPTRRVLAQRARREKERQARAHMQISSSTSKDAATESFEHPCPTTSKVYTVPANSLSKKVSISGRALAQRARREKERQARAHMQISSSTSKDAATESFEHTCPVQPSDAQVTISEEVDKMIGENSANRAEPKQTEGDIQIVSALVKAPRVSPMSAASFSKKINISKRATAQRARREKEKQYLLHSQVPSQTSGNERSTFSPATECSNNPCPNQPSDDQVTINVEVAKVLGEDLANRAEAKQTEGATEIISPSVKAPMVYPVPGTSSCKKTNISKRTAAQRARREKEKQERLKSQNPSQICSNEQSMFVPSTECSTNPCPIQLSDAEVTINVEVANVVGEDLANRAEPKQTEGDTEIMFPVVKAPMVSPMSVTSSGKTINISRRTAAQRARRENEKLIRLLSRIPSQISRNEESMLFPATEYSNNPRPIEPADDQVTVNVEVAKVVGEGITNQAKPKQTEGDTEIISPVVKTPMVSLIPATSSSNKINISKRTAAQRARREKEKLDRLNTRIPSQISRNKEPTLIPTTECSKNSRPIQPSDDQVTVNLEVAKAVGANLASRPFTEPQQTEGNKEIIFPIVEAPSNSLVPASFFSKKINTSRREAAQHARDIDRQDQVTPRIPLLISSNIESISFPATGCSENPRLIKPSDNQGSLNEKVAIAVNENLVNQPSKEPKQMEGGKEIISSILKAPRAIPISDASFREVINTSKRAAACHARKDKEKQARVELQIPSSALSEEQSVSLTEHSENPCPTRPSDGQGTVNLEVSKAARDDLTDGPFLQPMQKEGVKEIISPIVEAPRLSPMVATSSSKKINTSKRIVAQRARRENERKARVASQLLSCTLRNKRIASMRGTIYSEQTHFVQASDGQVNVNLEVAKVATENPEPRPFTEPKQKEGDKGIVSPSVSTRTPRPWLQQRRILLTTGASGDQASSSLRASHHQLRPLPPKQNFASVRASSHQLRSLPPKKSVAQVSSFPPKQSSCLKVRAFPPKQKSASHHKPTKWAIVSSSPVRTELQTNGLTRFGERHQLEVERRHQDVYKSGNWQHIFEVLWIE